MTTVTKMNPVEAFLKKVREDGQIRNQIEMLKTQNKNKRFKRSCALPTSSTSSSTPSSTKSMPPWSVRATPRATARFRTPN